MYFMAAWVPAHKINYDRFSIGLSQHLTMGLIPIGLVKSGVVRWKTICLLRSPLL